MYTASIARFLGVLLIAFIGIMFVAEDGHASAPRLNFLQYGEIVPDSELADMRGRFLASGGVTYFGISMYTFWRTADGLVMSTGLEYDVDLSNLSTTPSITFFYFDPNSLDASVDVSALLDSPEITSEFPNLESEAIKDFGKPGGQEPQALTLTATANGLERSAGAGQTILVSGLGNDVASDLRISIVGNSAEGSFGGPVGPTGIPKPLEGTATVAFSSGATATAFNAANQIGFVIEMNGGDRILQRIGAGQVGQHVNLKTNSNFIRNGLFITIGRSSGVLPGQLNELRDMLRLTIQ